jgi:hypothetical protein
VAEPLKQIQVPLAWIGAEDLPVHFANAFVGVVGPGEIVLQVGSVVPPAIVGATQEERNASVGSIGYVQVKPVVRLALTPSRLDDLIKTLEDTRKNYRTLMNALNTGEQQQ